MSDALRTWKTLHEKENGKYLINNWHIDHRWKYLGLSSYMKCIITINFIFTYYIFTYYN